MKFYIDKVSIYDKDVLYNLLQFALYDGSQYIDNKLNDKALFNYKWFENYFIDNDREAYIVKSKKNYYVGFVMINQNMKFYKNGYSVAEFFILPQYRRNHIGKQVAFDIFNMHYGNWEVEPIENSLEANNFWYKVIADYTKKNYTTNNKIICFKNDDSN